VSAASPSQLTLSAVVPATDAPATLSRVRAAIESATELPEELLIVDRPREAGAAEARNIGARRARGDVLVFVDADVEVHPDVFARIRAAFEIDPRLAAVFGSYDDSPAAPGVVSGFRNLLHHYVHQQSGGDATTFWAGLGAIRRDVFVAVGGFDERMDRDWISLFRRSSVEDIELGMRLAAAGWRIVLDPSIQGRHLKAWNLRSSVATDLFGRGVPWVVLLLRSRSSTTALNLGWKHRLSAATAFTLAVALAGRRPRLAVAAAGSLVALNRPFYTLLLRRRGPLEAAAGVGLHTLHHLTGVAAVPLGIAAHLFEQCRPQAFKQAGPKQRR